MKRLILASLLLGVSVSGYSAQPNAIGNVKAKRVAWEPYTAAQINLLTPDTTNQVVACSDCTQARLCISTGADSGRIGAYIVIQATAPGAGALQHCQ